MRTPVLEKIAEGRAELVASGKEGPYAVHLPPKRAARLERELAALGVAFGISFGPVPEPRDDGEEWKYLGLVLGDVHAFERVS